MRSYLIAAGLASSLITAWIALSALPAAAASEAGTGAVGCEKHVDGLGTIHQ